MHMQSHLGHGAPYDFSDCMVLHMPSATAWSGAVQTEEKGHFSSILDMSRWDTLGQSLQTAWHQLSWVASEGGLGKGLSEFPLAPPSQPLEVQAMCRSIH